MSSSNVQGITIASHLSKVEPTAYYDTREQGIYDRVLGGPYVVGGVRGVSIVEVVRVALMTIDMAQMRGTRLEVLITDLSKFFDVIPQDMHPLVGAWIGLGTYEELRAHTEGYSYVVPLGDIQSPELLLGVGVPQGSIQGVQAGITAAVPFLATLAKNYGRSMANPMRSVAQMW